MAVEPQSTLSHEQLLAAKERAEALNRAKSDFLATVSHELRVPLTGIIGMAQLLSIDCLLPGQKEQVDDILKASEHLLSLVNELLDLSKLESGQMELHPSPIDLKALVEEVADMLSFQASLKQLELMVNYEENVPKKVIADARVLKQVLLNLVGNALKFTDKGYVLIKAICREQSTHHALLELSVQDTGIGIPAAKREIIFDRFAEEDVSTTRRYGGIGLGLTLTLIKYFVELMGGQIRVDSEIGNGSTFVCTIPFYLQDAAGSKTPAAPSSSTADSGEKAPIAWQPYVLLVEDDVIVQKVHRIMLEKAGCKVDLAKDGPSALSMIIAKPDYSLILMDVGLPGMSGLEVTQKIRQQDSAVKDIPIVAMTAYVHDEDKNNCLAAGMNEVATKPISPKALKELLLRWTTH